MSSATRFVQLEHLGLVEARGADAQAFLQGQFSNDVRQATATHAQLSSYNSPKGRMLAVLHVFRGDGPPDAAPLLLELHRGVLDAVLKRLRLYVLRSKVTLEDVSARRPVLGVFGPEAADRLSAAGLPAPESALAVAWSGDAAVIRRQGGGPPRFTVSAPPERLRALEQALAANAAPAGAEDWKLLEIEAGIPTVYPETVDRFVPQMCNLDSLGGISFDKGCYTGQEIVARVNYRGAVKRRMVRLRTEGELPSPGARLAAPPGPAEVVDAARHAGGYNMVLAVVQGQEP